MCVLSHEQLASISVPQKNVHDSIHKSFKNANIFMFMKSGRDFSHHTRIMWRKQPVVFTSDSCGGKRGCCGQASGWADMALNSRDPGLIPSSIPRTFLLGVIFKEKTQHLSKSCPYFLSFSTLTIICTKLFYLPNHNHILNPNAIIFVAGK